LSDVELEFELVKEPSFLAHEMIVRLTK